MIESGRVEAITKAERVGRAVRVSWIGADDGRVERALAASAGVASVSRRGMDAAFSFSGSDEELAAVLAALAAAGVRVVFFGEVKQTIEDLYMRLSHHEVT